MNTARGIHALFVFAALVVMHYSIRPLLGWSAPIDFLIIAILLTSVRVRPGTAAIVGFVVGLAADSQTPAAFGCGALALTGVAYAASWLKAVFFADNLALNGIFFFLGKWVFDVAYVLVERRLRGLQAVTQLLIWSPLSAAVTAVAGLLLLVLLRPLLDAPET
jgi:rod shape-determining protein MreD